MPVIFSSPFSLIQSITAIFKRVWGKLFRQETDSNLRETLEELIEEGSDDESSIESDERALLGNVLSLRDLMVEEVMIPRADIIAVPEDVIESELITTLIKSGYSGLLVYRNTLDDVMGMVHIKDILAWVTANQSLKIHQILREVLFIPPSMRTLDLLFKMREGGSKMAVVVDEHGGTDGLVTFSDLIEEIIGDIQDAHDLTPSIQLMQKPDGSVIADARVTLKEIEEKYNIDLALPELEDDINTVGGMVVSLAGRVPNRGEIISHPLGVTFEVLEADPRRVKRLCVHNLKTVIKP